MKKIIFLFFFLLFSCSQNIENLQKEENISNNFLGFQIFVGEKSEGKSMVFYDFQEMKKILEKNSQKIYGFGDVASVHNDDIASMPDFLIIKILEKITKNPDKISSDFTIFGLQGSQIRDEKIFQKILELPIKNLNFSLFYADLDNF